MKAILGRKVGMTEVFQTDGKLIPVTVIAVEPNVVTQIKTVENDGYDAIQIAAFNKKEKASNRAQMGHLKKSNTAPKRYFKEIKGLDLSNYEVGKIIGVDTFEAGETVDVTGTSKGKGFQGVIKRWNQSRGPETHGSTYHRRVGSLGPMRPMRVLKGKKLPGHMGNEQITIQNLEIVSIDTENNYILISGNVPGPKKGLVFVRSAVKGGNDKRTIELVSYDEKEEALVETEQVNEALGTVVESVDETIDEVEETTEVSSESVEETTETVEPTETKDETEEVKTEEAPEEENKEVE